MLNFGRNMDWKSKCMIIVVMLAVLSIPIMINAIYYMVLNKVEPFKAGEILSFIGTFASSSVTLVVAILTINFTKKQIARQAFLEREKEKWNKVENFVAEVLVKMNPLKLLLLSVSNDIKDNSKAMEAISEYSLSCKIACDNLATYVNRDEDYPKIKVLVDNIIANGDTFSKTADRFHQEFQNMLRVISKENALSLLHVGGQDSLSAEDILRYQDIVRQADGISADGIIQNVGCIKKELGVLYQNEYRKMLALKGETFFVIMNDIEKRGNELLDG